MKHPVRGFPHRCLAGFTLIEVIIVVAVITLLAGLVVPALTSVSDDAKAAKVLAVVDTLKKAVERHYADTGTLATEDSSSAAAGSHELSITQTTSGWKGPYIDHPLTSADNPYGGTTILYDSFTTGTVNPTSFDLTASGSATHTGSGQYVQFGSIPASTAQAVDNILDKGLGGTWSSVGQVEYNATSSVLMIFVMDT